MQEKKRPINGNDLHLREGYCIGDEMDSFSKFKVTHFHMDNNTNCDTADF